MARRSLLKIEKAHMATDFTFEVVVEESSLRAAESVLTEAHGLVDQIESAITEFREESPVWKLNRSMSSERIPVLGFLEELLTEAFRLTGESFGYFNPCAKSETGVGLLHLEIDFEGHRMRRTHSGLLLGFGAIGKGYALDRVASLLAREGFRDFRLNAGGSSWVFSGDDQNEEAWKVGWAWKRDDEGDFQGRLLTVPAGVPVAVGISGTLEQGNHFRHEGRDVPVKVLSAFYAGRSATEADALSTALLVGASLLGDEILTKLGHVIRNPALAYIDLEEQIVYNRYFQTRFSSP